MERAAWSQRIMALRWELGYSDNIAALTMAYGEEYSEMTDAFENGTDAEFASEVGDVMVVKLALSRSPHQDLVPEDMRNFAEEMVWLAERGLTLTEAMQAAEDKLTARVAAQRKEP